MRCHVELLNVSEMLVAVFVNINNSTGILMSQEQGGSIFLTSEK